tara:strand:+ start:422 stop:1051 length:630 start_codon:yes stop_codon:yes gene_type:complete
MTLEELQAALEVAQSNNDKLQAENTSLASKTSELLNETKAAKLKAREEAEAAQAASLESAKKSGDFESLEKSWAAKLAESESKNKAKIDAYQANARKSSVDEVARQIASNISTNPDILLPHVKARLDMQETEDGVFKTVVKDSSGNLSASSIEDLTNELKNSDMFKPLIIGTKATGGDSGGGTGGQAGGTSKDKLIAKNKAAFQSAGMI